MADSGNSYCPNHSHIRISNINPKAKTIKSLKLKIGLNQPSEIYELRRTQKHIR